MKKLMFLLAAASLSSVAFAQQKSNSQNVLVGESVDVMEVPVDKYKVETNHFFDNWFFSVGGGAQVLFGDQSDLGKFKKTYCSRSSNINRQMVYSRLRITFAI